MFLRQISIEIRKTLKQPEPECRLVGPLRLLALVITITPRSTFASIVRGLGYTQLLEFFLAGIFHGADWAKWLFTNLHYCIMFLAGRPCPYEI